MAAKIPAVENPIIGVFYQEGIRVWSRMINQVRRDLEAGGLKRSPGLEVAEVIPKRVLSGEDTGSIDELTTELTNVYWYLFLQRLQQAIVVLVGVAYNDRIEGGTARVNRGRVLRER